MFIFRCNPLAIFLRYLNSKRIYYLNPKCSLTLPTGSF